MGNKHNRVDNIEEIKVDKVSFPLLELLYSAASQSLTLPKHTSQLWVSEHVLNPYVNTYIAPNRYYNNMAKYTDVVSTADFHPHHVLSKNYTLFAVMTKFKTFDRFYMTSFFADGNFNNKTVSNKKIDFYDLCTMSRNEFAHMYYDDNLSEWTENYNTDIGLPLHETFSAIETFYKKLSKTMTSKEIVIKYLGLV